MLAAVDVLSVAGAYAAGQMLWFEVAGHFERNLLGVGPLKTN